MFFYDVKNDIAHVFINTVDNNKSKYTIKEYTDAVCAHSLQHIIGWPSTRDFITYTEKNMIPNCPITEADILFAEDIFGTDVGALEGKTTRRKTRQVQTALEDLPNGMQETWKLHIRNQHYIREHNNICNYYIACNTLLYGRAD